MAVPVRMRLRSLRRQPGKPPALLPRPWKFWGVPPSQRNTPARKMWMMWTYMTDRGPMARIRAVTEGMCGVFSAMLLTETVCWRQDPHYVAQ